MTGLILTSTHLSYVARSTHLLNLSSYCISTDDKKVVVDIDQSKAAHYESIVVEVDGYDWEIRFYPACDPDYLAQLQLVFLGELAGANKLLTAVLSCRIVDPNGSFEPSEEKTSEITSFQHPSDSSQPFVVLNVFGEFGLPYFKDNDSHTLECTVTVTVFRDPEAIPVPSSNLHQHLGELLASQAGSDVTFTVVSSGESFPAHKNVLAARSPVFMAEFFGVEMQERTSGHVEVHEMEAPVFSAMLRFIYTDAVPELTDDGTTKPAAAALAQHLLVAADRYGLDRLRAMCERRLAAAVDAATVAATLALAERHGCARHKARCVEFATGRLYLNLRCVKSCLSSSRIILLQIAPEFALYLLTDPWDQFVDWPWRTCTEASNERVSI